MKADSNLVLSSASLFAALALAQSSSSTPSCSSTLSASYAAPSVASGYVAQLVANNLTKPRGIKFDNQGALLVVEEGVGITALNITDSGSNCLSASSRKSIIRDSTLNHGIELSSNGSILYASSTEAVYSWDYDGTSQSNTSAPRTLVNNMTGTDHTTRTLLLSKKAPGLMIVTRGSVENLDPEAAVLGSGHSEVKAYNLTNATGTYDYVHDGLLLGWGLRNEVGIDEEPLMGGIFGVENSVDQLSRAGQDIHEDNPGEEMNFLGYLNGTYSPNQGANFGYPECYAAWDPSAVPGWSGSVGQQFAIDGGDGITAFNDSTCAQRVPPRLTFQAHMAPLDILFNPSGTAAWVTFHGSWDRTEPVGYKLSVVSFADGEPTQPSNSTTAAVDVVSNRDNSKCPDGCFRPVGLAWDGQGRLFMSSDSTGEIYAILRADGNSTQSVGSSATGTLPSSTGSAPSAPPSGAAGMAGANSLAVGSGILALFITIL